MTVLVAYATTGGSTAEIAQWIGEELRGGGLTVEVRPAVRASVRRPPGAKARGWLGFLAERMEREDLAGDFRNPQRVRAWARGIAAEITSAESDPVAGRAAEQPGNPPGA